MSHTVKPAGEAFDRSHYPADAIFFFDFDGVLASQDEEKVFRLPEGPLERNELESMADLAGIDHSLYPNTRYLRHLIHQGHALHTLPEAHQEAVEFAYDLEEREDPYFIMTARSGLYAVERLMQLIAAGDQVPDPRTTLIDPDLVIRESTPGRPQVEKAPRVAKRSSPPMLT